MNKRYYVQTGPSFSLYSDIMPECYFAVSRPGKERVFEAIGRCLGTCVSQEVNRGGQIGLTASETLAVSSVANYLATHARVDVSVNSMQRQLDAYAEQERVAAEMDGATPLPVEVQQAVVNPAVQAQA